MTSRALPFALLPLALAFGCPPEDPPPAGDAGPSEAALEPAQSCPGAEGCTEGGAGQPLLVGAAVRDVTPVGFEIARHTYLERDSGTDDKCEPSMPKNAPGVCGELKLGRILDNCGYDGVCPGDDDYTAPDEDGSEGDELAADYFWDCGRDRICPPPHDTPEEGELATNGVDDDGDGAIDEGAYTAPDADGSEGDGLFQGLWIAGYGNNRPALGVKDPMWSRVVVMRKGDVTVALVTVDSVGYFYDETLRIREMLEQTRPGQIDLVVVQATHTHEAPDTLGQWGLEDPYAGLQLGHGRDDAHMELIRDKTVEAIGEALDGLAEASVRVGTVNTHVDGLIRDSRDPRVMDDRLTAIHFRRTDNDETIVTLSNWGNHPEILDSANNFISSDFAHAMREGIENGLPATDAHPERPGLGGVAIYQQGLVGGLMGPNGFLITARDGQTYENRAKTWERCDQYGELIAEQTFIALDNAEDVTGELTFSRLPYRAPIDNQVFHVGFFNGWFDRALYAFDPDLAIGEGNIPELETEVAVVRLGPIAWVTAPGELFPEVWVGYDVSHAFGEPMVSADNPNPPDMNEAPEGPYLRDTVGARFPLVMGLTPDESGYMVPPWNFELHPTKPWVDEAEGDHYEETNSVGIQAVPLYLEHIGVLIEEEKKKHPGSE